jgi:hypothetical protein
MNFKTMDFKTLTPADFATYKPYFAHQRYRLCDYSLAAIIAWQNDDYRPLVAIKDGILVVGPNFPKSPTSATS